MDGSGEGARQRANGDPAAAAAAALVGVRTVSPRAAPCADRSRTSELSNIKKNAAARPTAATPHALVKLAGAPVGYNLPFKPEEVSRFNAHQPATGAA